MLLNKICDWQANKCGVSFEGTHSTKKITLEAVNEINRAFFAVGRMITLNLKTITQWPHLKSCGILKPNTICLSPFGWIDQFSKRMSYSSCTF